jgi:hypothetical protein
MAEFSNPATEAAMRILVKGGEREREGKIKGKRGIGK